MNKVILCGNLTKDMDVKVIKGKTKKAGRRSRRII